MRLRKLLCFLGFHQHITRIDKARSIEWLAFCPKELNPTPCVYSECKWCGHTYDCRTVGISFQIQKQQEPNQ